MDISSGSDLAIPSDPAQIVDFAIWLLFRRHVGSHKPSHVLCQGLQRYATSGNEAELRVVPGVPGLFSSCENRHVESLKAHPWTALPALLGARSERTISDMLLRCGVFCPLKSDSNLYQISGVPLSDLKVLRPVQQRDGLDVEGNHCSPYLAANASSPPKPLHRGFSDIRFVRHRMLYAKPFRSSRGEVCLGFNQNHILTHLRDVDADAQTTTILKYIFPRQFGLHNAFTSDVDRQDTAQPFKDYTSREAEIAQKVLQWKQRCLDSGKRSSDKVEPLPKRFRGEVFCLIRRLRKRHARCPYHALLLHHCPTSRRNDDAGTQTFDLASSPAQVAAFCRAAVSKIIPPKLWGDAESGKRNRMILSRNIDKFVQLRRYESLSMHDIMQDMVIHDLEWLRSKKTNASASLSSTDFQKRVDLLAELLYYVLDSIVIPLIRSNFHVTESNVHKNQLFYFRHDVWEAMSRPALASLKHNMLEECKAADINKLLSKRALGVSKVRLLPKEQGMRPIINLRRRVQKLQHGKLVLGRSINSLLNPAFAVLNFEKGAHPEMLGSALFSIDDMFPRLQAFKHGLKMQGLDGVPLYFAKVDVQACFDTIPQKRLMNLVQTIIGAEEYSIAKYARAKLVGGGESCPGLGAKPTWRYLTKATSGSDAFDFLHEVEVDTAEGRNKTVYVDNVVQRPETRASVLKLLEEHVGSNMIKLGKRYYRQKEGIPQGSIVSSLLCSYMYAGLEREVLPFVDSSKQSLLLRLIDDFLVISTKREVAEQFVHVMHGGLPQFGVQIKVEKSRANFDIHIGDKVIPRLPAETDFPYCGNAINTITLDVSKDRERRRTSNIADSMTVEYSQVPGLSFHRKTLSALKLQMNPMLLSTRYNSLQTVLSNLYHSFSEVAQKSYHYIRSLPANKRPGDRLIIRTLPHMFGRCHSSLQAAS